MLKSLVESFVRKPLRRVVSTRRRRQIKSFLGLPVTVLHSDWRTLSIIGPRTEPHVVLDVGAHHGWFFHCWLDWCPSATVHAFEPYPKSCDAIRMNYGIDPRVNLHQVGVGEQVGELALHVLSESTASNSFLVPNREAWESVRYRTGTVTETTVPVTTIDAFVSEQHLERVYLVKIDVQGYELHVLRGAEQSLERIDHIFVESGIQRLYDGAPRFSEVFEYLTARGFHLMALRTWHRGNHVLMEMDMLFRRDGLAPPVDESVVKVMENAG